MVQNRQHIASKNYDKFQPIKENLSTFVYDWRKTDVILLFSAFQFQSEAIYSMSSF